MQQFTTTLFCIAMLLINSISVTAHTFEEVGFHAHTYTQSVKEYTINNHSGEESLQSCYCPDCFYSDNSNSNVSLAIVALSPWLMPVTIESDNDCHSLESLMHLPRHYRLLIFYLFLLCNTCFQNYPFQLIFQKTIL